MNFKLDPNFGKTLKKSIDQMGGLDNLSNLKSNPNMQYNQPRKPSQGFGLGWQPDLTSMQQPTEESVPQPGTEEHYDETLDDIRDRHKIKQRALTSDIATENQAAHGEFQSMLTDIISQGRRTAAASGLIGGTQEALGTSRMVTEVAANTGASQLSGILGGIHLGIQGLGNIESQHLGSSIQNLTDSLIARSQARTELSQIN